MDRMVGWIILGIGAFVVYAAYHGKPPFEYFQSIVKRGTPAAPAPAPTKAA